MSRRLFVVASLLLTGLTSVGSAAQPVERTAARGGEAWVEVAGLDSDGDGRDDRVHVTWRLPRGAGPSPVVVEASPYYAGIRDVRYHRVKVDELHVPHAAPASTYQRWLRPEGYAYVTAESIGSGGSTGCPSTGGQDETDAMVAVVEWLTGEATAYDADGEPVVADWSNGRVGMIGVSYNGTLPNAVAASGVEGLDAVVPISAISSWYDYYRSQGLVRAPGGYQGEDADVLAKAVLTRRNKQACAEEMRALRRSQARRTGDLTPFWTERDYRARAGEVTAGVLTLHGLGDDNVFSDQAGRWSSALADAGVPVRTWWHTGRHGDQLAWTDDARWRQMVVGWFDHFLRDADNGVLDSPGSTLVTRGGRLRTSDWPGGEPAQLPVGALERDGRFVDDARFGLLDLPERSRVLWRTPRLAAPLELSGLGSVDVELSVRAQAANLSVGLVALRDGKSRLLSGGWADPQNHASLAEGEALVPGQRYRMSVELDQVLITRLREGDRLALVVASSDRDHTLLPPRGTRLRVWAEGTGLTLPVVGGPAALADAVG